MEEVREVVDEVKEGSLVIILQAGREAKGAYSKERSASTCFYGHSSQHRSRVSCPRPLSHDVLIAWVQTDRSTCQTIL